MMKFRMMEDGSLAYLPEKKCQKHKKTRLEELADALEDLIAYEDMSPLAKEEIRSVIKELHECSIHS